MISGGGREMGHKGSNDEVVVAVTLHPETTVLAVLQADVEMVPSTTPVLHMILRSVTVVGLQDDEDEDEVEDEVEVEDKDEVLEALDEVFLLGTLVEALSGFDASSSSDAASPSVPRMVP